MQARPGAQPFLPPLTYQIFVRIFPSVVGFVLFNAFSARIFQALEVDWAFHDAFYHCMMTSTTIGLGEYAPTSQAGRGFAIVHILLSVTIFGLILSECVAVGSIVERERKRQQLLKRGHLDHDLLARLGASSGGGVDKSQFVCDMLVQLGYATMDDVQPFIELFERLDVDGSGHLDEADLNAGVGDRGADVEPPALTSRRGGVAQADSATTSAEQAVQRAAGRVVFASFYYTLLVNFCTMFGWVSFVAGVMQGVVLLTLLGRRLTTTVCLVGAVAASIALLISAAAFTLLFIWFAFGDPNTYYAIDPDALALAYGRIDPDTSLVVFDKAVYEAWGLDNRWTETQREQFRDNHAKGVSYALLLCFFFPTIFLDAAVIVACIRARQQLASARGAVPTVRVPATVETFRA